MTAPVQGFTADVPKGLLGLGSLVQIDQTEGGGAIEISLTTRDRQDDRDLVVSHDEARQIIAGLASVIE